MLLFALALAARLAAHVQAQCPDPCCRPAPFEAPKPPGTTSEEELWLVPNGPAEQILNFCDKFAPCCQDVLDVKGDPGSGCEDVTATVGKTDIFDPATGNTFTRCAAVMSGITNCQAKMSQWKVGKIGFVRDGNCIRGESDLDNPESTPKEPVDDPVVEEMPEKDAAPVATPKPPVEEDPVEPVEEEEEDGFVEEPVDDPVVEETPEQDPAPVEDPELPIEEDPVEPAEEEFEEEYADAVDDREPADGAYGYGGYGYGEYGGYGE